MQLARAWWRVLSKYSGMTRTTVGFRWCYTTLTYSAYSSHGQRNASKWYCGVFCVIVIGGQVRWSGENACLHPSWPRVPGFKWSSKFLFFFSHPKCFPLVARGLSSPFLPFKANLPSGYNEQKEPMKGCPHKKKLHYFVNNGVPKEKIFICSPPSRVLKVMNRFLKRFFERSVKKLRSYHPSY